MKELDAYRRKSQREVPAAPPLMGDPMTMRGTIPVRQSSKVRWALIVHVAGGAKREGLPVSEDLKITLAIRNYR
jgi:hypothetical protein